MGSSPQRVFVARDIPSCGLEKLRAACQVEVWPEPLPPSRETLIEKIRDCDGLLALLTDRVDAEVLDAAPKLKVVSNFAVGYNNIDVAAATARGVRVGNTPGVLTDATADIAIALLLAAARNIVSGHLYAQSGQWKTWEPKGHIGQDLAGKTLGVYGLGRIGATVARRLKAGWGMKVIYHNRSPKPELAGELDAQYVDFPTLLAESDFLTVHADFNPTTKGAFNRDAFRRMKKTAVFVNTARGGLHVQPDLVEALRAGDLFAAGLDVTDPEPPAADDPILTLPNAVVVPHVGSATTAARNAMSDIAADNLLLGLQGKPLRHWVNPESAGKGR